MPCEGEFCVRTRGSTRGPALGDAVSVGLCCSQRGTRRTRFLPIVSYGEHLGPKTLVLMMLSNSGHSVPADRSARTAGDDDGDDDETAVETRLDRRTSTGRYAKREETFPDGHLSKPDVVD